MRLVFESAVDRLRFIFVAVGISVVLFLGGVALALQFDAQRITQHARAQYGEKAAARVNEWLAILDQSQSLPESQRLRTVNDSWNYRVRGGEDIHIWSKTDYWATPLESLAKGAGDCED